jgi:branched-chain amino acid transport system permease protein
LENTTLAGMFGGTQLSRADAAAQAMYWLEFVGLADRARALPTELNLHQRKFLELSRALASAPRLVLLDEVLAGLTPSEINNAVALVREIRQRGLLFTRNGSKSRSSVSISETHQERFHAHHHSG